MSATVLLYIRGIRTGQCVYHVVISHWLCVTLYYLSYVYKIHSFLPAGLYTNLVIITSKSAGLSLSCA